MKKTLLLSGALLMLAAPMALAQTPRGDLTLGWDNCRVSGPGLASKSFACTSNSGSSRLVGAFIAAPGVVQLNSADMSVDIFLQNANVSPWWQHPGPAGSCRTAGQLSVDYTNAAGVTCANEYWTSIPGGPFGGFSYAWPSSQINHALLRGVVAVDNNAAGAVPPGFETYLFTAAISHGNNVAPQAICAGCTTSACISFFRAEMFQTNNDNFVITESSAPSLTPGNNQVTWQSVDGCAGDPTPTQNRTWGSIKAIYR